MAGEIQYQANETGATVYANLYAPSGGLVWDGSTFSAESAADADAAKIALTEGSAVKYWYRGDAPAGLQPGLYGVIVRRQAGASPAWTDPPVGGGYLDTRVITSTGARTITITVTDGTDPVQSASVRLTMGVDTALAVTNASGVAVLNVDDGTWTVAITRSGYSFAGASLVVSANASQSYTVTAVVITPSDPDMVTGYATCYSELGVVEAGVTVTATVTDVPLSLYGIIADGTTRTATSAANGVVQFANLIPCVTYRFRRGSSSSPAKYVTIPSDAVDTYALPAFVGSP